MKSLNELLTHDHRHCDQLLAAAEAAAGDGNFTPALVEFGRLRDALDRHMSAEENILFPAFEEKSGNTSGPTQVMREEHKMMRDLFNEMNTALEQRRAQDYLGFSETLLILLQQHNVKEENVLYPMAEQVLGSAQEAVFTALQAAGIGEHA
ncbi:MAG TPA: hemerythrin domain-containing protein [Candidatus Binatia bacterium]|uniref:Hemerythrin-like domain-containing protein n=1 Tax=Candidatus Muproteobacteria bacterium RBG_16_60_9 TaxID=1817755 RepID=A0A1F6VHC0_9PROT|nr:MAG: hypothetical protein A2W18_13795 [Candidatus Muproteobacteria bacterium RBG_16_60_9]HJX11123.1 hemerythrin domain-containing protein [Candidatus Binatia bacterium]